MHQADRHPKLSDRLEQISRTAQGRIGNWRECYLKLTGAAMETSGDRLIPLLIEFSQNREAASIQEVLDLA